MPITKLTPENNYPYLDDRLKALEQVVPEAFADGKINWDTLREVLGEDLEEGGCEEYFGLNWPGKREARQRAAIPSRGTLVPAPGEGVNEDETENLFIEGDNLEVLKLLQKSYAGKIKMIYIDPPYNTGNDFIYNDDFTDPLEAYLEYTGAKGEGGELLTTNTRADGRFHSKWLSMMYPRLILARQLLQDDGVIFISIDDSEVHNLRHVMNEVFGEENFIAQIPWQSRKSIQNDTDFSVNHEYIIGFAKKRRMSNRRLKENNKDEWYKKDSFAIKPLPLDTSRYSNPDNDPRGFWKADPFDAPNVRPNLTYKIVNPNTHEEYWPPDGRCWRTTKENYLELLEDNRIVFGLTGNSRPQLKVFYEEKKEFGEIRNSWFSGDEYGTTNNGTRVIQSLFEGKAVFDHPKPIELITELIQMSGCSNDDYVLDFFAGSSTTAEAILRFSLNRKHIKFIMVQLPEKIDSNNKNNKVVLEFCEEAGIDPKISELSKERIRRAIIKIESEQKDQTEKLPLFIEGENAPNLGFRIYEVARSNYEQWKPIEVEIIENVATLFDDLSNPLVEGWQKEDLLTEILLLEGFPLTSRLTYLDEIPTNEVYRVSAPGFCEHELYVCLDEAIHPGTIDALQLDKDDILICLDSALTDELKARLQDQFNVHVI